MPVYDVPPPPVELPQQRWFHLLYARMMATSAGAYLFSALDFTGSNLTSIATRLHNNLQSIQGGAVNDYQHLTAAQLALVVPVVASIGVDTALTTAFNTVLVGVTAKTMTLPLANAYPLGTQWTIILGVNGYVDIATSGANTFTIPTNDTRIRLTTKGATVTLRSVTTTSWGFV